MKLTIFTPTYNRAYILPELYNSLINQTNKNFEWLIIDDCSSDNTCDLINKWINEQKINIVFFKQEHGGKHRAINKALDIAKGEYIFIVDSDDIVTKDAVEKILQWINEIENDNRDYKFCGVAGLKVLKNGSVAGGDTNFQNLYVDATNFERKKYGLLGDKAEVYKTDIMRKFKFPEFDNEYFVTEDYCYLQIASKGYKIRWYNDPIYICDYLDDGLSKTGANEISGHIKNFKGYSSYIEKCIKLKPFSNKMEHFYDYIKTCKKMNISFLNRNRFINISFILYIFLYLFLPIYFLIKIFKKIGRRLSK